VGDGKLIIVSEAVRGINDHIRFYSQMLCTAAINTSNTTRTQTGAGRTPFLGTGMSRRLLLSLLISNIYTGSIPVLAYYERCSIFSQ